MTLGHVLRASDWEAIQAQSEINGANGLALCSWTESFLQYTPMGTYWPWSCPTEESIEQSKWNRPRNGKFLLEDSGAIKQAVRDTGAKIQVMIEYSNGFELRTCNREKIWRCRCQTSRVNYKCMFEV